MKPRLGMSVGAGTVRAMVVADDRIVWAGAAVWARPDDLTEAVARLAAETGPAVRRVRVVLERAVIQTRTVWPAPPLKPSAARRYVALEAPRLFRKNGEPLITDGIIVSVDTRDRALWAAAVPEPLVHAVLAGCAEAGLEVEGVGPAADVLPHATRAPPGEIVLPNGTTAEVLTVGRGGTWRSRLVAGTRPDTPDWHPAVATLGAEAAHFAPAYAAGVAPLRLSLLPPDARAAATRSVRRRLARVWTVAAALWLLAAALYGTRIYALGSRAEHELARNAAAIDSVLVLRRELEAGRRTLEQFTAAERGRSRYLPLLGAVTTALGDSAFLVALRAGPDGVIRFAGYAPSAARVVANLERLDALRDVRLEGPVTREQAAGSRELERFAIVAQRVSP